MRYNDRPVTNEYRYQAIKLWNSGQISLTELKAMFRIVATVSHGDFSSPKDIKSVEGVMARLEKFRDLSETRSTAKQRVILKMKPKPSISTGTREEARAKFLTGFKGKLPHDWKRYGPLVAKTDRYNAPRPNTSRKWIKKPKYIGFKEFIKSADMLFQSLSELVKDRTQKTNIAKQSAKVVQSVKVKVTPRY